MERVVTRLDWCEWRPGPLERRGYGGVTSLPLGRKEGEVKHSTEGSLAAALGVFTDPTRQASWHFTLPKQGPIRAYQHFELEDITWHCGLPGDERHDTSLIGNITLIGEEHEGRAGEPLTAWQVENSIALSRDIRALCPAIGVPKLRENLWEHGWLSGTACPSGRIPWDAIIAALQEDDMTPAQEAELALLRKQMNTLITQVGNLNTAADNQGNIYENITKPLQGQVDGLIKQHPPGAHAGGAIADIAEGLKLVPK